MKNLVFNANWWSSIKLLGLEDRKEVIYAIVAQELESEQPGLMSEAASTVWAGIAKELRLRRLKYASKARAANLAQIHSPGDSPETEQSNEKVVLSPAPQSYEKEKKKEKEPLKNTQC